jgi:hypothetical protein
MDGPRFETRLFCFLEGGKRKRKSYVADIEERFIAQKARDGAEYLSAQADAFAGSEREEKASACSARNDRLTWSA